jgi:hypothetical protein
MAAWRTNWGVDRTVNHTPGGSNSLRIVGHGNRVPDMQAAANWVYLAAGKYTLSAWLRGSQPNLPVTFEVLSAYNCQASNSVTTSPAPGNWQRCSLTFNLPGGSRQIGCVIYPEGNGTLWVDDVQLEPGAEASAWQPALTDVDAAYEASLAVHKVSGGCVTQAITPGGANTTVSIDSSGRFLVNGEPFIPMGLGWGGLPSPAVVRHIAQAGFNAIMPCLNGASSIPNTLAFLNDAQSNGLKVTLGVESLNTNALASFVSALTRLSILGGHFDYFSGSAPRICQQSRDFHPENCRIWL